MNHRYQGRKVVRGRTPVVIRRSRRQMVGWAMVAIGAVLFLTGLFAALTGTLTLPFDEHHVLYQVGGLVLLIVGLGRATDPSHG